MTQVNWPGQANAKCQGNELLTALALCIHNLHLLLFTLVFRP
jgi:hypothetical protein